MMRDLLFVGLMVAGIVMAAASFIALVAGK